VCSPSAVLRGGQAAGTSRRLAGALDGYTASTPIFPRAKTRSKSRANPRGERGGSCVQLWPARWRDRRRPPAEALDCAEARLLYIDYFVAPPPAFPAHCTSAPGRFPGGAIVARACNRGAGRATEHWRDEKSTAPCSDYLSGAGGVSGPGCSSTRATRATWGAALCLALDQVLLARWVAKRDEGHRDALVLRPTRSGGAELSARAASSASPQKGAEKKAPKVPVYPPRRFI